MQPPQPHMEALNSALAGVVAKRPPGRSLCRSVQPQGRDPELRRPHGASGRGRQGQPGPWTAGWCIHPLHTTSMPPTRLPADPSTERPAAAPQTRLPPRPGPSAPEDGTPVSASRPLPAKDTFTQECGDTRRRKGPREESPRSAHPLGSLRSPERPSNWSKVEQP